MATVQNVNITDPLAQNISQLTQEDEAELHCLELFFFIIHGPVFGCTALFGLIGNSLSYAVLHRHSNKGVSTYLLKSLALADNIFLILASLAQMFQSMAMYFGYMNKVKDEMQNIQLYVWPLVHASQIWTVWMMVLVAANRYIAVCMPLQAPRLCTMSRVKLQVGITALAAIVYNIPRFFEFQFEEQASHHGEGTGDIKLVKVNKGLQSFSVYNILYENIAYSIFVFLIPLMILIVLNWHLVRELKVAQRCRETLANRSTVEENNITLVMIIIIIIFIVCQTPACINQILYYTLSNPNVSCTPYSRFHSISNVLIVMNSSVNFIVYCVYRRQFQQEVALLFCKKRRSRGRQSRAFSTYLSPVGNSVSSVKHNSEETPLHVCSTNGSAKSTVMSSNICVSL